MLSSDSYTWGAGRGKALVPELAELLSKKGLAVGECGPAVNVGEVLPGTWI